MLALAKKGITKAWSTYLSLIKIMVPVYILVTILKYTGIINYLADIFSPAMKYFGLPGEAVLALLIGYLLNIYGAIAAISGLSLGVKEVTILGTMLGISHSLLIESAVLKKTRVNLPTIITLRLSLSILAGLLLNYII